MTSVGVRIRFCLLGWGWGNTFPAMVPHQAQPALEAILIDGVGGEDQVQQRVVEERLEGRDRGSLVLQQCGEGAGSGVGDR